MSASIRVEGRRAGNSDAVDKLSFMLAASVVTTKKPDWLSEADHHRADAYLLLGEDVAQPLVQHRDGELVATTLIMRGLMSEGYRQNRNASKQWRREGRRRSRVAQKLDPGRPRSGPDADEWSA